MSRSDRELAYRHDLFIAPLWRDVLHRWFEDRLQLPEHGNILEINCGTGAWAVEIASAMAGRGEVVAVDADQARLDLAAEKADVEQLENLFLRLRGEDEARLENPLFALAIGDASLVDLASTRPLLEELVRRTAADGDVALKLITRGSFGEFFSILWEALYDCGLTEYGAGIEALIDHFLTVSQAQEMMRDQSLSHVHAYVEKNELKFASAEEVFESPLIEDYLMSRWFEFLPEDRRRMVHDRLLEVLRRETNGQPFDLSLKTTLLVGHKETS